MFFLQSRDSMTIETCKEGLFLFEKMGKFLLRLQNNQMDNIRQEEGGKHAEQGVG